MKAKIFLIAVLLIAISASAGAVSKSGGGKKGSRDSGTMNVQVRNVIVRSAPNYLAPSAGSLNFGAQVNVTGDEGNWYRIESPSGFLPKSALTKRSVKVDSDKAVAGKGQSRDEVALAGKGFNPQVEAQYKRDNAELARAYVDVDRVETFGATEGELKVFQKAGKLNPR